MAGVTDRPFRQLCKRLGAGYAVSEMAASNPRLWDSVKTSRRLNHDGEIAPVAVQIAGRRPGHDGRGRRLQRRARAPASSTSTWAARSRRYATWHPARRCCATKTLVARILDAVVAACAPLGVPVTLKTRTGWDRDNRNALRIARLAEDAGIAGPDPAWPHPRRSLHRPGRIRHHPRRQGRHPHPGGGQRRYRQSRKARFVLDYTGADAVMIGRAAQGRPWIFREVEHYLRTGTRLAPPTYGEMRDLLLEHLDDHYRFYGEHTGVRTARKHIGWYVEGLSGADAFRAAMNRIDDTAAQARAVGAWFDHFPRDGRPGAGRPHANPAGSLTPVT